MSSLTSSPRTLKGGLLVLEPRSGALRRAISLQYNPDTVKRAYQVQSAGGDESTARAQPFRLKGPAVETISLEADIDATDLLERPDQNANAVRHGIAPQLALLEGLINPTSAEQHTLQRLARTGTLEIVPPEPPLVLFVWSASRVAPVRITELSVTEEAFDPALNPIRAKVSLSLRVLTTDDLGFAHRGAAIFLAQLRARETMASKAGTASLQALGLSNPPQ